MERRTPTKGIKYISVVAVVMVTQIVSYASAGELSPDLSTRLQAAHSEEYLSVIVRMADQADLKSAVRGIVGRNKGLRSKKVINKLRSKAQETQGDVLTFLKKEMGLGTVLTYESFWIFNGLSIKATPAVIKQLVSWKNVELVSEDLPIYMPELIPGTPLETASAYTWNIKRIRAPEVWQMGYDGTGVVVGVFDTGVDITHPDLADKYRGGNNSWFDPFGEHDQPVKRKHGTHVAGIILGGNSSGKHFGVAPGARFIAAKLNNDAGDSSDPLRVFQWFMDPDGNPETDDAPDVINNSWHTYGFYNVLKICNDYYNDAIQVLRTAGIVPVFSASNSWPLPFTSTSPAITPGAIVVGATNFIDGIGLYSSRGPNICDLSIYPDLCAPGVPILSSFPDGTYRYYSGTSMAAPHVTGVIALMLDANPDLTVDEIESVLKETARPLGFFHPNNTYGWGRVDALRAVEAVIP